MTVGQTVRVALKDSSLSHEYPWCGMAVPVEIVGEYEYYYLGRVLPHKNPQGFSTSSPYNVTLGKEYIKQGAFMIQEGGR